MARFDMGPWFDFCDLVSDKLNMFLCVGIVFAGLWQMNVLRVELIP